MSRPRQSAAVASLAATFAIRSVTDSLSPPTGVERTRNTAGWSTDYPHRLSDAEIHSFAILLLLAGSGTTWKQLGITLTALLACTYRRAR